MADAGLFVGWGQVARGRERETIETFNESARYWARLQQEDRIESFDVVLLLPHGGDLNGFVLLRGSAEQLDSVRREDEFIQFVQRAALVVDSVGVVPAYVGEGVGRIMGLYQQSVAGISRRETAAQHELALLAVVQQEPAARASRPSVQIGETVALPGDSTGLLALDR